jgi:hypothetical protein
MPTPPPGQRLAKAIIGLLVGLAAGGLVAQMAQEWAGPDAVTGPAVLLLVGALGWFAGYLTGRPAAILSGTLFGAVCGAACGAAIGWAVGKATDAVPWETGLRFGARLGLGIGAAGGLITGIRAKLGGTPAATAG